MKLLMNKDISHITMREIVEDSGVSLSFIHYHFKTKNDLFKAAMVESTDGFFQQWVTENIDLANPQLLDFERYIGGIIETIFLYPTIYRSKIFMFMQGVEEEIIRTRLVEDLFTISSALVPKISHEECKRRVHFLGQIIISLRISTSQIMNGTGVDFESKKERLEYSKMMINQIFPELY